MDDVTHGRSKMKPKSKKRLASQVFGYEENNKKQKNDISLPVEIIALISEFVQPKEFIMFSTLSKELRRYLFDNNIQYKGRFTFVPMVHDKIKLIPFVTNLKIRSRGFINGGLDLQSAFDTRCGRLIRYILETCPNLKSFDISENSIGHETVTVITDTLKTNKKIESINLSNTRLSDPSLIAIAKLLETNMNIKNIDLSFNSVGKIGCLALAEALKINNTVEIAMGTSTLFGGRYFIERINNRWKY